MLLAYVALKEGDEVGAMTFGGAADDDRSVAPRKGKHALNALIAALLRRRAGADAPRLPRRGDATDAARTASARWS